MIFQAYTDKIYKYSLFMVLSLVAAKTSETQIRLQLAAMKWWP